VNTSISGQCKVNFSIILFKYTVQKNTNLLVNVTPPIQVQLGYWELILQLFIQLDCEY